MRRCGRRAFDQAGGDKVALQAQVAAKVTDEITSALDARKQDAGEMDDVTLAAWLKAGDYARLTIGKASVMQGARSRAPGCCAGAKVLARPRPPRRASALLVPFAAPEEVAGLQAEARKEAARAPALNPRNGDAYLALALLVPTGHWAEQEAAYRRAWRQTRTTTRSTIFSRFAGETGRLTESISRQLRSP